MKRLIFFPNALATFLGLSAVCLSLNMFQAIASSDDSTTPRKPELNENEADTSPFHIIQRTKSKPYFQSSKPSVTDSRQYDSAYQIFLILNIFQVWYTLPAPAKPSPLLHFIVNRKGELLDSSIAQEGANPENTQLALIAAQKIFPLKGATAFVKKEGFNFYLTPQMAQFYREHPRPAERAQINQDYMQLAAPWFKKVKTMFLRNRKYSYAASGSRLARVRISTYMPTATIVDYELVQSSGDPIFDQGVLDTIKATVRKKLPPTPPGYPVELLDIVHTFSYTVDNSFSTLRPYNPRR